MKHIKSFFEHNKYHTDIIDNEMFNLKKNDHIIMQGTEYEVIEIDETIFKAKNLKTGKILPISYAMFYDKNGKKIDK